MSDAASALKAMTKLHHVNYRGKIISIVVVRSTSSRPIHPIFRFLKAQAFHLHQTPLLSFNQALLRFSLIR